MIINIRKTSAALAFVAILGAVACTQQGRNEIGKSTEDLGKDLSNEANRMGDKAAQAAENAASKVENAAENAAASIENERKELAARIEKDREEVKAELEAAQRDLKKASAKEKARLQARIKALETWDDQLEANMKELNSDAKREWKEFKTGLADGLDKLEKDLRN